jgi:DNA-binding response OmpR family regulator
MEPLRALIVEDEPALQDVLQQVLADDAPAPAVTAVDSALAAGRLARRLRPDVVLLDLGLPYRSGLALLKELKADPGTAQIPVVIVSGLVEQLRPEVRALADAVIGKPFHIEELRDTVRAVCGRAA